MHKKRPYICSKMGKMTDRENVLERERDRKYIVNITVF